jgi:hypothetical protein
MRDEGRSKKRPSPGRAEAVEADINAVPKGQERQSSTLTGALKMKRICAAATRHA